MFFAIFFQILGVGLFSISVTTVVLYTNFFTTTCGTVNGRVCNNRGTCGEGGFCICDPIFNGLTCEDTRAPAYDSSTGTVCNGNGMASPLLLKNQIPSVCFQNTPTAANGFDMSGPGWGDQGCINYVQTAMDRYAIGDYSLMEGVPTCACFPGFGGLDCGLNYCPQDSNFDVCSGNGNTSVGIVRNDTTTGNGCQCDNYLSLYNLVSLLTTPELAIVTGKYLDDFRQGFCGTPIRAGSSLIIKSQQPDYVCYCQALYTGEACEYGVCPENQGIICSGHGNPDLGFGLLRGVTSNELIGVNPADCTVVCTPPAIYCNGRCTSPFECNVKYEVCPITQPYRCATGACVSGSTPHCDMSYETGTWDDITNMPHSIECSLATVAAQPSFLRRRRKMEACFGIGSYNTIDGFIASNIPFTTSSRIMAIDIMLFDESNKSMISVSYGGVIYNTTGEFHYRLDLLRSETQVIEDYFQLVPMIVKANRLSPERVVITPNPYLIYPQVASFRFQASEYIVGIYDHSFNTLSTTGDMFIAIDPNSNLAFNYQGNLVNQQSCLNTISGCLWFITTYSSVDGSKFVCKTGTSYVVQNSPCALQYNVTGNFVATNMIISTNNSWSYVDPFAQWKTYIAVTTPIIPPVSIFSTSPITNIQFLLEEDIHHICICPPYGINQSALNENWLSETSTRDLAVNTGEYVVGRRQVNGYITTVRGIVQESNTLLIASGSNQYLLEETGLVISSLEYQSGTPDDDININPVLV